jgi:hypothetical protein
MYSNEFQKIENQISALNTKVDHLYKRIDSICVNLDIDHGNKLYVQLNDMMEAIKTVYHNVDQSHMVTIKSKIDLVMKTVEQIRGAVIERP